MLAETAVFIDKGGDLNLVAPPAANAATIADIEQIFLGALKRARTTWRISLLMTVSVFVIVTGMISIAVTLALLGERGWALIFGGTAVPAVVGVLIWKPYDRLFSASVITQQMEMIHLQTIAGFRSTLVLKERVEICEKAINQLSVLLPGFSQTAQRRRRT